MNLILKRLVKYSLKKYRVLPSKKLGQHFLIDKGAIIKMIKAAELSPNDVVLEIGPGIGNLTVELAKRVKEVIAIEKDPRMVEILKETQKNLKNLKIIQGDIRRVKFQIPKNYKVVGNLPFYLTAPVMRKFLENVPVKPRQMVLMVQKEVAQRICAKPPDMNLLAVSVQFYSKPEIISYVSRKSFWPKPRVDSAILRINPRINTDMKQINTDLFFKVVKAGFSQPRKQILNNFRKMLKLNKEEVQCWLSKNNIHPTQRAETLSIKDWLNLTKSYNDF
jgi:16S rRNA (adenine1518-N6/adenine1519-N6)-dimethyltransferase